MSKIDWSKAPDWAVAHALYAFGGEISEVWVGSEQYQRLDHPKSFPYGGGAASSFHNPRRHQFRYETLRPSPWTGEGLPPIGAELEAGFACEEFENWHKGICVASGEDSEGREEFCVVQFGNKLAMYTTEGRRMRPIRTAEQIAADKRRAEIVEMIDTFGTDTAVWGRDAVMEICGHLWESGYRKQEPTQ